MSKFKCEINLLTALDWQRSNAEKLILMMKLKQLWYEKNFCQFWNDWVKDVFTLDTANDFGLSVWSVILNEPLFAKNSGNGYETTIEQKRIILKLKAYILSMSGSVFDINRAMINLFGENKIICVDNLNMTLTYLIYDQNLIDLVNELRARDLLPRPAAVGIKVKNANIKAFGFGSAFINFNNGNFYDGTI